MKLDFRSAIVRRTIAWVAMITHWTLELASHVALMESAIHVAVFLIGIVLEFWVYVVLEHLLLLISKSLVRIVVRGCAHILTLQKIVWFWTSGLSWDHALTLRDPSWLLTWLIDIIPVTRLMPFYKIVVLLLLSSQLILQVLNRRTQGIGSLVSHSWRLDRISSHLLLWRHKHSLWRSLLLNLSCACCSGASLQLELHFLFLSVRIIHFNIRHKLNWPIGISFIRILIAAYSIRTELIVTVHAHHPRRELSIEE